MQTHLARPTGRIRAIAEPDDRLGNGLTPDERGVELARRRVILRLLYHHRRLFAPGVGATIRATRRLLPLRLRRETELHTGLLAEPPAERVGIVPRDEAHGKPVGIAGGGGEVGRLNRPSVPCGLREGLVLPHGHRVARDKVRTELYQTLRGLTAKQPLIHSGLRVVRGARTTTAHGAAHHELPRRDLDQVDAHELQLRWNAACREARSSLGGLSFHAWNHLGHGGSLPSAPVLLVIPRHKRGPS